jgi:glutamate-5-semialdehyde dehydrogenase
VTTDETLARTMQQLGRDAVAAQRVLSISSGAQRNLALHAIAASLRLHQASILAANERDMSAAIAAGLGRAALDRLQLDAARVEAMAHGVEEIAALPDPIGTVLAEWTRWKRSPFGRVRVPLGVIGIIYESRPNVTCDAGALCLKSANAAILRGGSESHHSSIAIHACLVEGVSAAGLPDACIQLVPTTDRAAVGQMLAGMTDFIDVIVPRGGKSLIARVQQEARVPVIGHLEGLCHVYVDRAANLEMARSIVLNAKLRRTGVCGAAETLLVDAAAASTHLAPLVRELLDAGCEVRGDAATCAVDARVVPATDADWHTEYLDAIIAVKLVNGVQGAIEHVARYGSDHTDSIVTDDVATAETFLARVDSAIVLHNASTQFADGGEFGMGAEIGISTDRFHARGPVGIEQLTSYKYVVRGSGQVRP